jgi:uncharacterized protein
MNKPQPMSRPDSPPPAFAKGPHAVRVERSHFIEARDGVRLSTDLYFPVGAVEPLPVILERTPYNKATHRTADPDAPVHHLNKAYYFASHGYVFAVQDNRGKFESEGEYVVLNNDVDDAADTFDWFTRQAWFNGRIGMIGVSIPGAAQIKAAQTLHPALAALIPQAAATGHGTAGGTMAKFWMRGGVQNLTNALWCHGAGSKLFYRPSQRLDRDAFLAVADLYDPAPKVSIQELVVISASGAELTAPAREALMSLPLVDIPKRLKSPPTDWDEMVTKPPLDPWWDAGQYLEDDTAVDAPALHINAWHDYGVNETFLQFEHFRTKAASPHARDNQFVIISPMSHGTFENLSADTVTGERHVGDARFDLWGTYLRWYDYQLKGIDNGFATTTPKIQYYVPGLDRWKSSDVWPLRGTQRTRLYLGSAGRANTRLGDGVLSFEPPSAGVEDSDSYVYDPADPVYEMNSVLAGSFDVAALELRADILVYSTPPLTEGIEMTGHMRAMLHLSTDVPDTDVTVKIVDVHPDGRAFSLQQGYLRLRWREGYEREVMMKPGEVVPVEIDMLVYSNYFKPGHRIRIDITSSNMPHFGRNLNTGGDNARDTTWRKATVTLYHGARYPSCVELPFVVEPPAPAY